MSLIRLEAIEESYHGQPVLDGVDLRVEEGEKVSLIGRNGSGESTCFRIFTGEVTSDAGNIERMRPANRSTTSWSMCALTYMYELLIGA